MNKRIIIIVVLAILDGMLLKYFQDIETNKKTFQFEYNDYPILVNTNSIQLNEINVFKFKNYFNILSFNETSYKYTFEENDINVLFNDNYYKFPYEIIKPEIITEVIYVENEASNLNEDDYIYDYEEYFYVDNDYLQFNLDEDLSHIRQVLSNNIHTTYETNIDYSELNVSQVGLYSVYYSTNSQKIEIFIEIS